MPLILQAEAAECALACIAMVAGYHGRHVTLAELRQFRPVSLRGLALTGVIDVAGSLQLQARALRLECTELRQLRLPCILHWRMNHFVVLECVTAAGVQIADPAIGRVKLPHRQCSTLFTGVALELQPSREFSPRQARPRLKLADLLRGRHGIIGSLAQILLISLAIQVFALAMPAYLQLAIDQVVPARDGQLLALLALAFAGIALLHAATTAFRAWCIYYFGTRLNFAWTSDLFHWLMRQPLRFFESRSIGDVQSRFASLQPLRELVASRAIETVVDGLMALSTGLVILLYGNSLALAVFVSIALYAVLRLSMFPLINQHSRETLVANAAAETYLLESIRGAVTIKNLGLERYRLTHYSNRIAEAFNASTRVRRLSVIEKCIELALFSLQGIVVVYVGVSSILQSQLTVGMLVAFLAYSSQFSTRCISLIHGLLEFRLIRIHLDRIADIAESAPEPADTGFWHASTHRQSSPIAVDAHKLWFRYAPDARWILRDLSLSVAPGECVGIAAPSGYGKTTLLKVMVGLLGAERGETRFDGRRPGPGNLHDLRRHFGIVMQQEQLLSGTLAQNIAGFDELPDPERIIEAATLACIDSDIRALPMAYLTLVSDMGETFSGGQKQRILLARALYRRPRLLFLDEATSNVDTAVESRIVRALRTLEMTRIVIAHRQETLAMCDRVIHLANAGD
ncbi:MAG TPA: peptidase domain-containing ABC transporter [Woeseiaceae bacterium]|nr:peptidase domain-containing ABC transporter [Woeseiaceae bacterium]